MITKSLSNVFGFIRPFIKIVQLVSLNSVHLMKIMRNMNIKANKSLTGVSNLKEMAAARSGAG